MDEQALRELLTQVKSGGTTVEQAMQRLRTLPYDDMGYACLDNHRALRTGCTEVVFGEGKSDEHLRGIIRRLAEQGEKNVLVTRLAAVRAETLGMPDIPMRYHADAHILVVRPEEIPLVGEIAVVTAGTSDIAVAEEAAVTAETLGNRVTRIYDVGVSGLHRTLSRLEELRRANVLIVIAGMEGALASVVGGLVSRPVIAVPTSVGYGASFGGVAALLAMLNSCASGVSVVNIDNGFGAAYCASTINHMAAGN